MVKNALSLFIITVIIVAVFLPPYTKMQDLKQKNQEFAQRIVQLEAKNKKMQEEERLLQTDPEYLEKVGREKMGLIRQGETMYKIVPAQTEKK
ncbi:MAG: septum formation initiator family protein [Candidatus Omnitrophica bacterium]|nr:septum formation initiator family protein [Candidatus Omnitrophota bacterium]